MGKVGIMGRWGSLVFVPLQYTPPFVGFLVWYFGLSPWHIWTLLNVEIKEQSRGRVASKLSVIFSDISNSLSFKESIITPGHVLWLFFCLSYIQLVNYLPFTTWPTFHPSKHAYRAQQTGKSDLPLLDEEDISERLADFDATTENSIRLWRKALVCFWLSSSHHGTIIHCHIWDLLLTWGLGVFKTVMPNN